MARKPLLSGPVLNREDVQSRLAGDDVMSRIISNDREKNGRAGSPNPDEDRPSFEVSIIPSNDDAIIPSHTPSSETSITPSIKASKHHLMETSDESVHSTAQRGGEARNPDVPKGASPVAPAPQDEAETSAWTAAMRDALDQMIRAHLMQQMMTQNEKGPVTRLNVEMAEDLHLRLKQSCVIKRRPIKAVINALIAFYLEQEEV